MVPLREGPRYWNQGLPPTSGTQSLSPPAGRVDDSFKLDAGLALNLVVFFLKESCSREEVGRRGGDKGGGLDSPVPAASQPPLRPAVQDAFARDLGPGLSSLRRRPCRLWRRWNVLDSWQLLPTPWQEPGAVSGVAFPGGLAPNPTLLSSPPTDCKSSINVCA